jgi:hypothetical protein
MLDRIATCLTRSGLFHARQKEQIKKRIARNQRIGETFRRFTQIVHTPAHHGPWFHHASKGWPIHAQALLEPLRAAIAAYQAAPDGDAMRVITVAARLTEDEAVVTVSDAAGPIPEALMDQVFVPFAPIRTWTPSGGLGLAKCWQAMLAMGGQVTVAHVGAGARVELHFDQATLGTDRGEGLTMASPVVRGLADSSSLY